MVTKLKNVWKLASWRTESLGDQDLTQSTMGKALSNRAKMPAPITLKNNRASAVRLAVFVPFRLARIAVTHVPMFRPNMM